MHTKSLRIGGVPEHFNLPLYRLSESQPFNFDFVWTECPGGTGQMNTLLDQGELDMAIMLTEGAAWNILKGAPNSILEFYTLSPLRWGIHTGAERSIDHALVVKNKRFAISRMGSGSHLMATVYGSQMEQSIEDEQWDIINDIHGGIDAVCSGRSDYFLWEKFTTKPYVDSGQLKVVGEVKTPWPCFVLVVRNEYLTNHPEAVEEFMRKLQAEWKTLIESSETVLDISHRFKLKPKDVEAWYSELEWNVELSSRPKSLIDAVRALQKVGRLRKDICSEEILKHYLQGQVGHSESV